MEDMNKEELSKVIETSVDQSVDRAFQKYGKPYVEGKPLKKKRKKIKPLIIVLIILIAVAAIWFIGAKIRQGWNENTSVESVEGHDLTLSNRKIFGFKAVDFSEPILAKAQQQQLLIVEEQNASVNSTVTDAGFLNLGIFTKSQVMTIHGTGEYTIDLSQISQSDISVSNDYVVTVLIPHAELHSVSFDPYKTEISDPEKGWLAFGSVSMTVEQVKEFETEAKSKLETTFKESDNLKEADRFAKLTATEQLQKIVGQVSPAYKVTVAFKD